MEPTIKKHILLAEDESALRELYKSLLEQEGYDVTAVENGEAAYQVLVKGHFDLLLLDILMPKLSGLELLEILQKEEKLSSANAIVMLTNLSDDTKIAEALKYGIRGYMVKSNYTPDTFIQEVRHYFE
ncbi:response regulator [Candidatus Woesebacteria bacterium]|nr:response regulator [Candidatus Woesebacteria bacterium]